VDADVIAEDEGCGDAFEVFLGEGVGEEQEEEGEEFHGLRVTSAKWNGLWFIGWGLRREPQMDADARRWKRDGGRV
jgi:hypothetical protein